VNAAPPIRRSALESTHAALGAEWISETVRWPVSYGDPASEGRAVEATAGLAEVGPLDKVVVRGPGAAGQAARLVNGRRSDAWALATDEVIVVGEGLTKLRAGLEGTGPIAVDVSSAYTVLRLAGPSSVAVLEEVAELDPTASGVLQAPVANVRAIMRREDDRPTFTILVARDEAEYVWDALLRLGRPHGLRPVGPVATAPIRARKRAR
jgi:glycine cleavage system aminomethyltransferase T